MLVKTVVRWHQFFMMKNPLLIFTCLLGFTLTAFPQAGGGDDQTQDDTDQNRQEQSDRPSQNGFWEAKLGGGDYVVALSRIASVSRHKYVLDGAVIVDEVTIDTTGQALARFYFISPITSGVQGAAAAQLAERALGVVDGAARTAGSELQDMVVKKYPVTTHAKTIEYRVLSEAQLGVLFQSAKTAWLSGKGRVFTGN